MSPTSLQNSSDPTQLPSSGFDIEAYRKTKDAQALVAWVQEQHTKAKNERSRKQLQWVTNMSMFYGNQWLSQTSSMTAGGFDNKLFIPKKLPYRERRVINRTRSFVRTELAKFVSKSPTAMVVPATADDEDLRAAYAAEQAWESISNARKLQTYFKRAQWWTIVTGNGFIKTYWDNSCVVDASKNIVGDIRYGAVTPFHLFVPDLREQDIEDQPFIINAYTKPVEWCQQYYADNLNGITLKPTTTSGNQIIEANTLNLGAATKPDSCTLYETWVKPGGHKLLPDGGCIITIDDTLIDISMDGMPYNHGEYPFTKFEHIPTATFYADSPLVDTNQLQKEFNQLRSEISEAGRRMARPQLVAQQGSIVTSKLTNEPGLVIQYRPGTNPPQPIPLAPLPQYYIEQQDRILSDWEDITGQHDATNGTAPAGVTAGTAINYLQEKDDSFLSTEYESVEDGWQRIAGQTIQLFVQYVDVPRKIKTTGDESSFDVLVLSGDDLKSGTDIRMEKGSSISQSQAGKQAQIQSMYSVGMIDQPTALRLMEIGGVQKVLDVFNVAQRKAQRENIKMKMLTPDMIQQHEFQWQQTQQLQQMEQQLQMQPQMEPYMQGPASPQIPGTWPPAPPPMLESGMQVSGAPADPTGGAVPPALPAEQAAPSAASPDLGSPPASPNGFGAPQIDPNNPTSVLPQPLTQDPNAPSGPPPLVPVDNFDIHQIHIEEHNKFRMSQAFESLPVPIKLQFELHVKMHEQAMTQTSLQQFLSAIPEAGGPQGGAPGGQDPNAAPGQTTPDTMSANGAVPDLSQGGPTNGQ